jgi:hypothetical protein
MGLCGRGTPGCIATEEAEAAAAVPVVASRSSPL